MPKHLTAMKLGRTTVVQLVVPARMTRRPTVQLGTLPRTMVKGQKIGEPT
jgi:hypothetical protein